MISAEDCLRVWAEFGVSCDLSCVGVADLPVAAGRLIGGNARN